MLSFEGIPAFYIHSLFGTRNNISLMKKTGIKRSINRTTYDYKDIMEALKNSNSHIYKVFTNILNLIEIRKKQLHLILMQLITLNLGNNFFGIWRQSIDRKQVYLQFIMLLISIKN